ncbi:MAG: hypothetical protein ACOCVM_00655 [Desulfovibrionaceae bacterium]
MSHRLTLALLLALLLAAASPASAREPAVTILYSGNTYGEIAPCPS